MQHSEQSSGSGSGDRSSRLQRNKVGSKQRHRFPRSDARVEISKPALRSRPKLAMMV